MKKHLSLFAAAALAVSGMGLSPWTYAQDQSSDQQQQSSGDAAGQAGQAGRRRVRQLSPAPEPWAEEP